MRDPRQCAADAGLVKTTLASVPIFQGWPAEPFAQLCDISRMLRYRIGETIIEQGKVPRGMYVIASGCVEISSLHAAGQRHVRRFAEPGRVLGLLRIFDEERNPHQYQAHLRTELAFVPRDALLRIIAHDDRLWLPIVRQIAAYQRELLARVDEGLVETLRVRLARAVITLARAYGTPATGEQTIGIKLTQDDLGALLGVTRQSIFKELRLLETQGVLRVGYGKLIVVDAEALGRVADEPSTFRYVSSTA